MKANRITIISYTLAIGITIGYWAGQENIAAEFAKAPVAVVK